jgi:hypothetical protein
MPLSLWAILGLLAAWSGTYVVQNITHQFAIAKLEKRVRGEEKVACNIRVADIANGLKVDADSKVLDGEDAARGVVPIEAAEIKDLCIASSRCRSHGVIK